MKKTLTIFTLLGLLQFGAQADDYLCEENRSTESIETQRWFPEEFPLKVYVPEVPYAVAKPEMYVPLVHEAFATWAAPFPALRFKFVDRPEAADIRVQWEHYFKENAWGLAYCPILYKDSKGKMRHRSIIYLAVNAQPGSGMSVHEPVPFSYYELLAIAKHEVGHALGLGHSKGDSDLMGPQGYGYLSKSVFQASPRDIQTLLRLYSLPRKLKRNPCAT